LPSLGYKKRFLFFFWGKKLKGSQTDPLYQTPGEVRKRRIVMFSKKKNEGVASVKRMGEELAEILPEGARDLTFARRGARRGGERPFKTRGEIVPFLNSGEIKGEKQHGDFSNSGQQSRGGLTIRREGEKKPPGREKKIAQRKKEQGGRGMVRREGKGQCRSG